MASQRKSKAEPATIAEARVLVVEQDARRLLKSIIDERARMERARESHRKAKVRFERLVAESVSSAPAREDWYDHPGAVDRRRVIQAAELSTMQLHRLMERCRRGGIFKAASRSKARVGS